jgi:DNA ligase-1
MIENDQIIRDAKAVLSWPYRVYDGVDYGHNFWLEGAMADLADGETAEIQGSGSKPYLLRNVGGVYSCSCPAWRNQSVAIEKRTCKHIKKLRGEAAELERVGSATPSAAKSDSDAPGKEAQIGPPLLLGESWDGGRDCRGWWISEKLDGVHSEVTTT